MKNKVRQMFKDKLVLVMLVLGLLTIVAAAGVVTIQRGGGAEENPYLSMEDQESLIAEEAEDGAGSLAGASEMEAAEETDAGEGDADGAMLAGADREEADGAGEPAGETDRLAAGNGAGEDTEAEPAGAGNDAAMAQVLNFAATDRLAWPVRGSVLIDYSMETTTYFPTLEQYKCSPGIVVQSEVSTPVYAPAAARVLEVGSNEELGNFVTLDLGNEYRAVCGQLKEIPVAVNDYVEKGSLLGYVAEPTKYYSVEGSNVYFEMTHEGTPVDPLDYLE